MEVEKCCKACEEKEKKLRPGVLFPRKIEVGVRGWMDLFKAGELFVLGVVDQGSTECCLQVVSDLTAKSILRAYIIRWSWLRADRIRSIPSLI